jgi:hypothetical protein
MQLQAHPDIGGTHADPLASDRDPGADRDVSSDHHADHGTTDDYADRDTYTGSTR